MQVVRNSRIVFICVKPQYVKVVLEEVRDLLTDEHVLVSIAAGVPISALKVLSAQATLLHDACASHRAVCARCGKAVPLGVGIISSGAFYAFAAVRGTEWYGAAHA